MREGRRAWLVSLQQQQPEVSLKGKGCSVEMVAFTIAWDKMVGCPVQCIPCAELSGSRNANAWHAIGVQHRLRPMREKWCEVEMGWGGYLRHLGDSIPAQ